MNPTTTIRSHLEQWKRSEESDSHDNFTQLYSAEHRQSLEKCIEALEMISQDDWSAVSGAERSWEYAGQALKEVAELLG